MKRFLIVMSFVAAIIFGVIYSLDWKAEKSSPVQPQFDIGGALIKNQYSSLYNENSMQTGAPSNSSQPLQPAVVIQQGKTYTASLKTTAGEIVIALNAKAMPFTVNNFVFLAKNNFYNNTIFHRVIKDFMIQGGDPKGDGTGNPGYRFKDEPFEGEYTRGTVAMANSGPDTNGSQFFIMHADYALPKNYVIFGKVIQGMDAVDKIAAAPVENNGVGENSKPINPVRVESVEILEK